MLRVPTVIAAAIVEAEHADVAVAYPGAYGLHFDLLRRERGVA